MHWAVPPPIMFTGVRIGAANAMLLAENIPVLDVCSQVGYMSLSSFNRQFRKLTGESPRELRTRMQNKV